MILHLLILAWLAVHGDAGTCSPQDVLCYEPPRPVRACFVRGEPCE